MTRASLPKKPRKLTEAQILLGKHLLELGFQQVEMEYEFCFERKWRADIRCYRKHIEGELARDGFSTSQIFYYLFEADGGMFRGGHRRGTALEKDYERQNWAAMNGYRLLRFTNRQILSGEAKSWIERNL